MFVHIGVMDFSPSSRHLIRRKYIYIQLIWNLISCMYYIVLLSPSSQLLCILLDYNALNYLLICMAFPLLLRLHFDYWEMRYNTNWHWIWIKLEEDVLYSIGFFLCWFLERSFEFSCKGYLESPLKNIGRDKEFFNLLFNKKCLKQHFYLTMLM